MKKAKLFLFILIAVVAGTNAALADGYIVDFNTPITTSNHDFKVAKGWGHIVPNSDYDGYGPYYMTYSYYDDKGVDGTGTLYAARQYAGDSGGGETVYDLLVTPTVNGTVTLDVKASISAGSSNNAFVEVYAINDDGTRGSLLNTIKKEIAGYNTGSNTKWTTFTLAELTEGQKLGLRLQYVYVDNFTASSVDIPKARTLEVTSVANLEGKTGTDGSTTYFQQQADGSLKVQLKVTLTNTGDFDFAPGDEGYSLTLARAPYASSTKTYYGDANTNISEPLAAGETKAIDVDFTVPYTAGWAYWFVRENISGTTSSSSRYAGVKSYESKFVFREAGSTTASSLTADNWGTITESKTKKYEIANTGTAPLKITTITLPAGFTCDNTPEIPAGGLELAAGATLPLNITNAAAVTGTYAGTLSISYIPALAEEATSYTMELSATVISANTWTANFNNTSSTLAYPAGAIAEGGINSDYQYISSSSYNNWIKGRNSTSYATEGNKFITPLLHAAAGDKLAFDVKGVSGANYYAKVYVSTDRKTWGDPVAYYAYAETAGAEAIGSSWVGKTIAFDAEGDYYVAFALYGEFCIDNIVGLEKVDVAHDLFIKSVSWPHEAGASVKSGTALTRPSVDIIPLTKEAADAYTVKYVYGDNEVAIASKALTASANSTTTFTASFTPTVDKTTTFTATKVVFAFTDGTTMETDPFDFTVTNEPVFHFLNNKPASKWYEPTDRTEPITFGRTNAAATQSFIIFNWGSAPLTVNAITLPEGFTTTAELPMTVAPFNGENDGIDASCQTLDITFSAESAGDYSGDMVITYSGDRTFTLPVSGTMLDPAKWYAHFNDQQWPEGTVYQKNVSTTYVDAGDYAITCSGAADNLFITPKLTAVEGEKLAFDAKLYSTSWSEGKVVVYAAATREELVNFDPDHDTRKPLFIVSGLDETAPMTTSYHTYEVPAVAGDNYYAFEISGRPYVDEIYGLTLTDVAHDWMLVSANIPAEAMQNVVSKATVSIANFGLADETADSYAATLFIDDKAAATAQGVELPMSHQLSEAGHQLSISFRSPKVGTFPVYIEVKAGDYSLKTETVEVTFVEEQLKSDATAEADGTSSMAPVNLSYKNSETVSLYTSDVLTNSYGLTDGAKIKSITYKGYKTTDPTTSTLNIWYEWTDDATQAKPADGLYNTEGMTQLVASQVMTWETKGTQTELADFIVLSFDEPLLFEQGKALRIVVRSNSDDWKQVFFEKSKTEGLTYYHQNDTKNTFESNSWSVTALPLLHFGLEATATTFSGTVKGDNGEAIEGAVVTLVSTDGDNVQYTGTTDATGAYTISVIQAARLYNVTVTAENYTGNTEEDLSFAAGDVVKDFVLVSTATGINTVGTQLGHDTRVYTLDGKEVRTDSGALRKGIYIIRSTEERLQGKNGRKIVVK